jgi:uncharacterized protein YggE
MERLRRALQGSGIARDSLLSGSRLHWWRGRIDVRVVNERCVAIPRDRETGAMCRPAQDTVYRARDAIEVHVGDLAKLGGAIDSALAHGATDISEVRFHATDVFDASVAAMQEATRRARAQAEAIAAAGGGRLGKLLHLSTEPDTRYNPYTFGGPSIGDAQTFDRTQIIQRPISVSVTVYGRWQFLGQP